MRSTLWPFLAGLAFALPVYAQSECDQIRNVRKLAYANGLDESSLATLEAQYCGNPAQDCADMTILFRLTALSTTDTNTIKQTNKRREQVCSSGSVLGNWSNGTKIRDSRGDLYYSNGSYARSGKTWLYLNNNTARDNSDNWYYPNAGLAKDFKKNWYDPSGNAMALDDLLSWSCDRVKESFCSDSIRTIKAASGDDKVSAIVQFVWVASQTGGSYGGGSGSGSSSGDCADLTFMARLATLSTSDNGTLQAINKRQKTVCATGTDGSANWPNGTTAKYSSGSWNYPNGTTAKYSSGSWNYANGTTAKYTSGSWNYPNGTTAIYSSGSWNDPNGSSIKREALLEQSCEKVPEVECNRFLQQIKLANGDERTFSIIEFAWTAWNWKGSSGPTYNNGNNGNSNNNNNNGYSNSNQDCELLDFMSRFAVIGGGSSADIKAINKRQKTSCASGDVNSFNWSNGTTGKASSGKWYYPNGLTARTSDGKWYYPNGLTARTSDGKWYYPNGLTARTSDGKWYDPNGLSISADDLLNKACEKLPAGDCDNGLNSLRALSGESKILGIIEFSWTAWNWKSGY